VIDDGGWKRFWAEMTDSELEDWLFTYFWLSLHTPNTHAGRVAQLIDKCSAEHLLTNVKLSEMWS
jgi:hypothetical protein